MPVIVRQTAAHENNGRPPSIVPAVRQISVGTMVVAPSIARGFVHMPSFDVVSEVDMHEVTNAVDQANREVGNRFDFKGSNSNFEQNDAVITLHSGSEFQLQQMLDILQNKLIRRGVDIACLKVDEAELTGKKARQVVTLRQGIDAELARRIVKLVKDSKVKTQAAIQGEKVRVSGKKRDDLQQIIALLREANLDLPLQYENFRD